MWLSCCNHLHLWDQKGHKVAEGIATEAQLRELFQTPQQQLLPLDRYLVMDYTLDELLRMLADNQDVWLHTIDAAIKMYADSIAPQPTGFQTTLNDWIN